MAEAAGDISVIVNELSRYSRYNMIYSTLSVIGQNDYRSGQEFIEDALLQHSKDMAVSYDDVGRDVRQEKGQGWERRATEKKN